MTVQGVGAALSPAIGGWLAQELGYPRPSRPLGALPSAQRNLALFSDAYHPACAEAATERSRVMWLHR